MTTRQWGDKPPTGGLVIFIYLYYSQICQTNSWIHYYAMHYAMQTFFGSQFENIPPNNLDYRGWDQCYISVTIAKLRERPREEYPCSLAWCLGLWLGLLGCPPRVSFWWWGYVRRGGMNQIGSSLFWTFFSHFTAPGFPSPPSIPPSKCNDSKFSNHQTNSSWAAREIPLLYSYSH